MPLLLNISDQGFLSLFYILHTTCLPSIYLIAVFSVKSSSNVTIEHIDLHMTDVLVLEKRGDIPSCKIIETDKR